MAFTETWPFLLILLNTLVTTDSFSHNFTYVKGLDIGSFYGGDDVAHNGMTSYEYWLGVLPDQLPSLETPFYLNNTLKTPLVINNVTLSAIRTTPLSALCYPELVGLSNGTVLSPHQTHNITVIHHCTTNGTSLLNLTLYSNGTSLSILFSALSGPFCAGFQVGLQHPFSDIVYNSMSLPLWNPNRYSGRVSSYVMDLNFFFMMAEGYSPKNYSSIIFNVTAPEVLDLVIEGNDEQGTFTSEPMPMKVLFYCKSLALVDIFVVINLDGYNPVIFAFRKDCNFPNVNLNIGSAEGSSDIVAHGVVDVTWNEKVGSAFLPAGTTDKTFWASYKSTDGRVLVVEEVDFGLSDYCLPFLENSLPFINSSIPFTVTFNCSYFGSNETTTHLQMSIFVSGFQLPVTFKWMIYLRPSRAPLNMGIDDKPDYVISWGQPSVLFHPKTFTFYIPGWKNRQSFFLAMANAPQTDHINITQVWTVVDNLNPGDCTAEIATNLFNISNGTVKKGNTYGLDVIQNCKNGGYSATITVGIEFDRYPPIQISFFKVTGGLRKGFCVGTRPFASDIVDDGSTLPLWNDQILANYKSYGTKSSDTIYFSMLFGDSSQAFSEPLIDYSVVPLQFSGSAAEGGIVQSDQAESLTIHYSCTQYTEGLVSIEIPIPPFESIAIQWIKQCGTFFTGFSVGTVAGACDVVSGGVTDAAWFGSAYFNSIHLSSNYLATEFWLSSSNQNATINQFHIQSSFDGNNTNSSYEGRLYISNGAAHCWIFVEGMSIPFIMQKGLNYNFDVVYNCTGSGTVTVNVTLHFDGPHIPIRYTWKKDVGGSRFGFTVGTAMGRTDVVSNGTTQGGWAVNATSHANIPADTPHADFYLYIIGNSDLQNYNQTIDNIVVDFLPALDLNVVSTVPAVLSTEPQLLRLEFNCLDDEASLVEVSIFLQGFDPITFSMIKQCPPYLRTLKIGSEAFENDVISNGQPQPSWSLVSHNITRSGNVFTQEFYATYTGSINVQSMVVFADTDLCSPYFSSPIPAQITANPTPITITNNCTSYGESSNITFVLNLDGNCTAAVFRWNQLIGGPRSGFNIGTQSGLNDVVSDGLVQPGWSSGLKAYRESIDPWTWRTQFYLWMDESTQVSTQQFGAMAIYLDEKSECSVTISGMGAHGGIANNQLGLYISLLYSCPFQGYTQVNAILSIEPFQSIVLHWEKQSNGVPIGLMLSSLDSNVISNGVTNSSWSYPNTTALLSSSDNNQANHSLFTLQAQAIAGDQLAFTLQGFSVNATGCKVKIIFPNNTTNNNFVGNGSVVEFYYDFPSNCTTSLVRTTISFKNGYSPLSFAFTYQRSSNSSSLPVYFIVLIIFGSLLAVFLIFAVVNHCVLASNIQATPPIVIIPNEDTTRLPSMSVDHSESETSFLVQKERKLTSASHNIQSCPDYT